MDSLQKAGEYYMKKNYQLSHTTLLKPQHNSKFHNNISFKNNKMILELAINNDNHINYAAFLMDVIDKHTDFYPIQEILFNLTVINYYTYNYSDAFDTINLIKKITFNFNITNIYILFILFEIHYFNKDIISCGNVLAELSKMMNRNNINNISLSEKEPFINFIYHIYKLRLYMYINEIDNSMKEYEISMKIYKLNKSKINKSMKQFLLFEKSKIQTKLGNYEKAKKSLKISDSKSELFYENVFKYNNLGCILFSMNKRSLSKVNFAKSLILYEKLCKTRSLHNINTFSGDLKSLITYNYALSIIEHHPKESFDCFRNVIKFFYNKPTIWLRMAQCCIAIHKKETKFKYSLIKKVIKSTNEFSNNKKLVIANFNDEEFHTNKKGSSERLFSYSINEAITYLQTSITLFIKNRTNYSEKLMESAYVNMMYLCLITNNLNGVLMHSKELYKLKNVSDYSKYITDMYVAETLCKLNRPNEALLKFHSNLRGSWLDNELKASLYVNFATIYILKNEMEKAKHCIQKAMDIQPVFIPAIKTSIYIKLREYDYKGSLDSAYKKI